jgi:hypothetical protein
MSEYDDLIEQAAAQLAGSVKGDADSEARLWATIDEAIRLRSGRTDDLMSANDAADVFGDVITTFMSAMKAKLMTTLPGKLGGTREEIEQALDREMARMFPREQLEQMFRRR